MRLTTGEITEDVVGRVLLALSHTGEDDDLTVRSDPLTITRIDRYENTMTVSCGPVEHGIGPEGWIEVSE